jgi:hypothetical protein
LFIDLIGIMLEHSTLGGEEGRASEPSGHSPPLPPSALSLQNDVILMAAKLKELGDVALIVVDPRPASITDLKKCTRATSTPAASAPGRMVSAIPLHLWPNRELRQRLDPKELAAGDPHITTAP